jgi:nucleotide-binding universal stress UspA family protein
MRRYLIVAHRTLCGEHLVEKVKQCRRAGDSEFHLLVPVHHPRNHAWSDGEVEHAARKVLDEGVARFADEGIEVTGEVGDANPVEAIAAVLRRRDVDEIILSTLPKGPSKWLKTDVLHRVERQFPQPVTHVMPTGQTAKG